MIEYLSSLSRLEWLFVIVVAMLALNFIVFFVYDIKEMKQKYWMGESFRIEQWADDRYWGPCLHKGRPAIFSDLDSAIAALEEQHFPKDTTYRIVHVLEDIVWPVKVKWPKDMKAKPMQFIDPCVSNRRIVK